VNGKVKIIGKRFQGKLRIVSELESILFVKCLSVFYPMDFGRVDSPWKKSSLILMVKS